MQQQAAAVDMTQEVMSQTCALGCALDDTRDICHDKGLFLCHADNAQIGNQGGKVIVCDLRTGSRDHGKQRGLADIREADQTDVCQQLQFQRDLHLNARQTGLCKARCLTGRSCKMGIAPAAVTALSCNKRLVVRQILHNTTGRTVADDGAARYTDNQIGTVLTLHALAHTVLAVGCDILFLIPEVQQRGQVIIHLEYHRAAASAVTAVRTARSYILLTVEADLAVAALTGCDFNFCYVNKHIFPPWKDKRGS